MSRCKFAAEYGSAIPTWNNLSSRETARLTGFSKSAINTHRAGKCICNDEATLDNGSDWFRQTQGRDSDPGLMVFDVTPNGFDLSSLTIITA